MLWHWEYVFFFSHDLTFNQRSQNHSSGSFQYMCRLSIQSHYFRAVFIHCFPVRPFFSIYYDRQQASQNHLQNKHRFISSGRFAGFKMITKESKTVGESLNFHSECLAPPPLSCNTMNGHYQGVQRLVPPLLPSYWTLCPRKTFPRISLAARRSEGTNPRKCRCFGFCFTPAGLSTGDTF